MRQGNESRCIQLVQVSDDEDPVIACAAGSPFTLSNTLGECGYVASGGEFNATGSDNCGVMSLTHDYGAWGDATSLDGATFPVGTTVVTWTVVDAAGNTDECSITITVEDDEAPEFVNCPTGPVTIGADADCSNGVVWSVPVAEDNCEVVSVVETG